MKEKIYLNIETLDFFFVYKKISLLFSNLNLIFNGSDRANFFLSFFNVYKKNKLIIRVKEEELKKTKKKTWLNYIQINKKRKKKTEESIQHIKASYTENKIFINVL